MTLLIAVFAAIVSTISWYRNELEARRELYLGTLSLMYWGASLMWMVDAVFEFTELGVGYFTPAASDVANDAFLGVTVVALGLVIWLAILFIKDPAGVIKKSFMKEHR